VQRPRVPAQAGDRLADLDGAIDQDVLELVGFGNVLGQTREALVEVARAKVAREFVEAFQRSGE
jgi:hypothetical protein